MKYKNRIRGISISPYSGSFVLLDNKENQKQSFRKIKRHKSADTNSLKISPHKYPLIPYRGIKYKTKERRNRSEKILIIKEDLIFFKPFKILPKVP